MMAGKARPSRITPDVLEKEAQVLKLRRVGFTFDLIAKELGYSHASGAQKAYVNACKRIVRSDVEEIRKEEQDRLDIAQTAIWQGVLRGDVSSVSALIRIMERRARLLGLDMPTKQQIEVTNTDGNTIDAEVARLVALLDSGKASALDASVSESGTTT
jgi:hypothetical protein